MKTALRHPFRRVSDYEKATPTRNKNWLYFRLTGINKKESYELNLYANRKNVNNKFRKSKK